MRPLTIAALGVVWCLATPGAWAEDAPSGSPGVLTPEQNLIGRLGASSDAAARRAAMSPAQRLATTYMMGLVFEASLKRCSIALTGAQQATIDAKLVALRAAVGPQMDAALRQGLSAQSTHPCSEVEKTETTGMVTDFIDETPDDFAAGMEQRAASGRAAP